LAVVGAEVQHLAAVGQLDSGTLRRGYQTLVLVQSCILDALKLSLQILFHFSKHKTNDLMVHGIICREDTIKKGKEIIKTEKTRKKGYPQEYL